MKCKLLTVSTLFFAAPMLGAFAQSDWNELPLEVGTFREFTGEYRQDVIDIPLRAGGELEYKLWLEEGDAIIYEWNVVEIDDPNALYAEFHGHTEAEPGEPGDLMFYRRAHGGSEQGMLVAPFTGIHGWYLVNGSDAPIVVRLEVAGFYSLVEQ